MKVLIAGDLHTPVDHPGYLQFLKDLKRKYRTNKTVFIGDIVDWHAISFHAKEPECPGPLDEYKAAKDRVKKYYEAFREAIVCIGNHDWRPNKLSKSCGIPDQFLKSYNELWGTPRWKWVYDTIIDDVYYTHGTGSSGIHPAWNKSTKLGMSVVIGHCHARAGIKWRTSPVNRWFAMDVGCGIDNDAFQFVYGKTYDSKPVLAAGLVLDGEPIIKIMPMAKGEKYHKDNFV